jgi:hypothetical protein
LTLTCTASSTSQQPALWQGADKQDQPAAQDRDDTQQHPADPCQRAPSELFTGDAEGHAPEQRRHAEHAGHTDPRDEQGLDGAETEAEGHEGEALLAHQPRKAPASLRSFLDFEGKGCATISPQAQPVI